MNEIKQLKRHMLKVNQWLRKGEMALAKQRFDEAWEMKNAIGEKVLVDTDFKVLEQLWHLRDNFYTLVKPEADEPAWMVKAWDEMDARKDGQVL